MGKKCFYSICLLIVLFLCSCGENSANNPTSTVKESVVPNENPTRKEQKSTPTWEVTQTPEERSTPEPTEEPYEVTEKKNIEIGGRRYTYAAYARTVSGTVTLMSLKTDEDVLYIPSEIEGDPVVMLGWPEETKGVAGYEWSDQIEPEKLGWNGSKKKRLKKIIISEGIERIENLFCSVDEIIVPESMVEIEDFTFSSAAIKKVVIKSNKVKLGMNAFAYSELEEIQLPSDYRGKIDSGCFKETHLKSFRWPAYGRQKITDIESDVFEGCKNLKQVIFPENQACIYIPARAFWRCKKLKKLEFPASTQKVVYRESHYADNFKHGVSTLVFKGKDTQVEGGDLHGIASSEYTPEAFISVSKIIAPKDSKAIRFAQKAVKIPYMKDWKPNEATCENDLDFQKITKEDLVPVTIEIRN